LREKEGTVKMKDSFKRISRRKVKERNNVVLLVRGFRERK